MSYDLGLSDPLTGTWLELDSPHQMKGGTYAVGGTPWAALNVTYNYAPHYYRVFPVREGVGGIRSLYGLTGAESLPILDEAIRQLGDETHPDYWKPVEGNAKAALYQLKALAQMRPDGIWKGD
jgi:hypothetical protein